MNQKSNKPKQTAKQLIKKMKEEKGIQFKYVSEESAESYLDNRNNYLRTTSYRKNYPKHTKGINRGKYIGLDFSYLQELSTIDMHFRFLIFKMCSDLEHALKVQILKDIEYDTSTDGYDIVASFLSLHSYIISKLESTINSPFTKDLFLKYFTIQPKHNSSKQQKIVGHDNCPIWVLLELLTFGDFIKFYKFYYSSRSLPHFSSSIIHPIRSLRNAAAHNNCLLSNLSNHTSQPPFEISQIISKIDSISAHQRKKKLSCRPMLEFVCLLYVYQRSVSPKVKFHRTNELKNLFFVRMAEKKNFFTNNELIKSNYEFACKIISAFF